MDIITELKLGNTENNFLNSLIYIEEQQELWNKKAHIFNIINLVNRIEQTNNEGLFEAQNIAFIEILHKYNSHSGNFVTLNFLNQNKEQIPNVDREVYNKLSPYFAPLDGFNDKYIEKSDFELSIDLKQNIKEQIFNVLLSAELKNVIEYSQMQIELENGNHMGNIKKTKI
jgi:predicted RNA-binding protein with PIN domain